MRIISYYIVYYYWCEYTMIEHSECCSTLATVQFIPTVRYYISTLYSLHCINFYLFLYLFVHVFVVIDDYHFFVTWAWDTYTNEQSYIDRGCRRCYCCSGCLILFHSYNVLYTSLCRTRTTPLIRLLSAFRSDAAIFASHILWLNVCSERTAYAVVRWNTEKRIAIVMSVHRANNNKNNNNHNKRNVKLNET